MNITIELPNTFNATSRGQAVNIDMAKLSPTIIAQLALHGLQQKVADAASGAKAVAEETGTGIEAVTLAMMVKAVDSLVAGEWTTRVAGEGVSELTRVQRSVMKVKVKAKYGAKSAEWAKFTGLSDGEQNAELDRWFAKNVEKLADDVAAEMKRREDARKAKAKLATSVAIDL